MARSRNIKPGFFRNEYLADLPPETRLLFAGLWTLADREGRLVDRPKKIKIEIFPFEDYDANEMLQQLADSPERFITRYEVDGVRYIQVNNFSKHQNPHCNEVDSKIPAQPVETRRPRGKAQPRQGPAQGDSAPSPVPDQDKHGASTVLVQDKHGASTVLVGLDSLIPDSLIPDSLIPDSLIPDSLIPDSKDSCPERLLAQSSAPEADAQPVAAILLPLNDGTEHPVTAADVDTWAELYPAVDVPQELRAMKGWLNANPTRRKTKSGVNRFVNSWLAKAQNKGGSQQIRGQPKPTGNPFMNVLERMQSHDV